MAKVYVQFDLPDREPGEPDLTEEQFVAIKSHQLDFSGNPSLHKLGRYQAAILLRKIEEKKLSLLLFGDAGDADGKADEPANRGSRLGGCLTIGLAAGGLFTMSSSSTQRLTTTLGAPIMCRSKKHTKLVTTGMSMNKDVLILTAS